jgi:hypothetical protein
MKCLHNLRRIRPVLTPFRSFADNTGTPANPKKLRQHNQTAAYKPTQNVNTVIKESPSAKQNIEEKTRFAKLIKDASQGLMKNFKNDSQRARDETMEFQVKISKHFDGKTFSLFLKHLSELRKEVIEPRVTQGRALTADVFLPFLDHIRHLTHSDKVNELVLQSLSGINLDLLKTKSLLNTYQEHSADFKFEEKIRMGEIKKFASTVIP